MGEAFPSRDRKLMAKELLQRQVCKRGSRSSRKYIYFVFCQSHPTRFLSLYLRLSSPFSDSHVTPDRHTHVFLFLFNSLHPRTAVPLCYGNNSCVTVTSNKERLRRKETARGKRDRMRLLHPHPPKKKTSSFGPEENGVHEEVLQLHAYLTSLTRAVLADHVHEVPLTKTIVTLASSSFRWQPMELTHTHTHILPPLEYWKTMPCSLQFQAPGQQHSHLLCFENLDRNQSS